MSLTHLTFSLSWQVSPPNLQGIDMDIAAFLLAEDKKIIDERGLVFYHNPQSPDAAVQLSFDDRIGKEGEIMHLDLTKIDPKIEEIILVASIYEGKEKGISFGKASRATLMLSDDDSTTLLKQSFLHTEFMNETAIEFGRLFFRFGRWRFEGLGIGYVGGLERFVDKYVV